mmetsp:Transcript_32311/g.80024  ORF Transcript_32311/g.80024 Transcript_32311/m.80024 type:complete len:207 (-) Transcript_32311:20-640(-)
MKRPNGPSRNEIIWQSIALLTATVQASSIQCGSNSPEKALSITIRKARSLNGIRVTIACLLGLASICCSIRSQKATVLSMIQGKASRRAAKWNRGVRSFLFRCHNSPSDVASPSPMSALRPSRDMGTLGNDAGFSRAVAMASASLTSTIWLPSTNGPMFTTVLKRSGLAGSLHCSSIQSSILPSGLKISKIGIALLPQVGPSFSRS